MVHVTQPRLWGYWHYHDYNNKQNNIISAIYRNTWNCSLKYIQLERRLRLMSRSSCFKLSLESSNKIAWKWQCIQCKGGLVFYLKSTSSFFLIKGHLQELSPGRGHCNSGIKLGRGISDADKGCHIRNLCHFAIGDRDGIHWITETLRFQHSTRIAE